MCPCCSLTFLLSPVHVPKSGILCHLFGGDTGKGASLIVEYECDPARSSPPEVKQVGALSYRALMRGEGEA